MTGHFDYSLFGLHVRSELCLPELIEIDRETDPHVTIQLAHLPLSPDRQGGFFIDGGYLLTIAGVGRYFIRDGREITVDPEPSAGANDVRLFLLGSAMGALLHQRGLLPLHANAVEVEGRAFAFMGESGAGKSTLAAWFNDEGYRIIADDVCVVLSGENGRPTVSPGVGRLRLWREVVELSGRDVAQFERSFTAGDVREKYDIPLARPSSSDAAVPLAAVYALERGDELTINQLAGAAAVEAVFANTYRGALVPTDERSEKHWSACISLVQSVPIFRAARPWTLDQLSEHTNALVAHARSLPRA